MCLLFWVIILWMKSFYIYITIFFCLVVQAEDRLQIHLNSPIDREKPSSDCLDEICTSLLSMIKNSKSSLGVAWESKEISLFSIRFFLIKTHCKNGHPLEGDNLLPSYLKRGQRVCKICNRIYDSIWAKNPKSLTDINHLNINFQKEW